MTIRNLLRYTIVGYPMKGANLNQTILVGRISSKPVLYDTNPISLVFTVKTRMLGKQAHSNIRCYLQGSLVQDTAEYIKIGHIIGIKGHIDNKTVNKERCSVVVAEKVTYIMNQKKK